MVEDSGTVDILPKEKGIEGMTYNGLFLFKGLISIDIRFVFCKFFSLGESIESVCRDGSRG